MKTTLLLFFSIIVLGVNSQNLTLTKSAYEPIVGDTRGSYNLDTTFYSSGLPTNLTGTAVTWDYSNLVVTPTLITTNYIAPSSATVTAPVGSTYAEEQNGSYNFFKSVTTPTTQTEIMSVRFGTTALTFTNTGIVARYPIDYGYSLTDAIAGTVTFSLPASFTGSITTTADAMGTLLMPQTHTFSNVLRVKSVQTISINVIFVGKIAEINQTVYSYYHASSKFPILTITNASNTFSNQPAIKTTGASGNAAFLAIGIKENSLGNLNFAVYPNPAINEVSILLEQNKIAESISVVNSLGQKIRSYTNTNQINISELPQGIYYLEVKADGYFGRKPLVKTN